MDLTPQFASGTPTPASPPFTAAQPQPGTQPMPVPAAPGQHPGQPVALPNIEGVTPMGRPWSAIFAAFSVIIALIGLFAVYSLGITTKAQISRTEQQIKDVTSELQNEPLASTENQILGIIGSIQGYKKSSLEQYNYSYFNQAIREKTPAEVTLDAVTVDEKGTVRIAGTAGSFIAAGKALLAYRQASLLSAVSVENAALTEKDGQQVISFAFIGKLKTEVFRQLDPSLSTGTASPKPSASPSASDLPPAGF